MYRRALYPQGVQRSGPQKKAIYSPASERAPRCPYKTHAGKTRARRMEDRESKASRFTQTITLQDLALKKEVLSFFLPSARLLFLRFRDR
jgi:hypothetical protein